MNVGDVLAATSMLVGAVLLAGFAANWISNYRHEKRQAEISAEREANRQDEVLAKWERIGPVAFDPVESPAPIVGTDTVTFTPDFSDPPTVDEWLKEWSDA